MSERLAMALFGLKIVQMLSALSTLVLVFASPEYTFIPVIVFGATAAAIGAAVVIEGLVHGRLLLFSSVVGRRERPLGYWTFIATNVVGVLIGLALTQVWRLYQ
jgi:hypothetical protein